MLVSRIEESAGRMPWGIFDFRDSTWLMNEPSKRGWTRKPTQATPYASWDAASTDLAQFVSSAHAPAIRPRLLPQSDEQHR